MAGGRPGHQSPYGAFVSAVELVLFSPLFVFALRSRARPRASTAARLASWAAWGASLWLIGSSDPVRQRVVGALLREDTEYAGGYSEDAFRRLTADMTDTDVRRVVGTPVDEWWSYATPGASDCRVVRFEREVAVRWPNFDRCTPEGVRLGMPAADVQQILGAPREACWAYSRSRNQRFHQSRVVCFEDGHVTEVRRRWSPPDEGFIGS